MQQSHFLALLLALLLNSSTARGAELTRILKVTGYGSAVSMPDTMEFNLRTQGAAEMVKDAQAKQRESRNRILEICRDFGLPNLAVSEAGFSVATVAETALQGAGGRAVRPGGVPNKPDVEVASDINVRLTGIDKLSPEELQDTVCKLMDFALDNGARPNAGTRSAIARTRIVADDGRTVLVGGPPLVQFIMLDTRELRKKALRAAVADARARGEELAELCGAKLGPVVNVEEWVPSDRPGVVSGVETTATRLSARAASDKLNEITINAEVRVTFTLEAEPKGEKQ